MNGQGQKVGIRLWRTSFVVTMGILTGAVLAGGGQAAETVNMMPAKIVSLNMHGYHPFEQSPRTLVTRSGRRENVWPHLHYFTPQELHLGHHQRLDKLAEQLAQIEPHIVLLQEVGAGRPEDHKSCRDFYNENRQSDWLNSAFQLRDRLADGGANDQWSVGLACRGNLGWVTNDRTFADQRVETADDRVVFDFGANPYPRGVLIEGFAVLARRPWQVRKSMPWELTINDEGQTTVLQLTEVEWVGGSEQPGREQGPAPWLLVLNIHGGHKLEHFEQAVAIRRAVTTYLASRDAGFVGVVAGGDFNGRLYSGDRSDWLDAPPRSEISTLPWQLSRPDHFDWQIASQDRGQWWEALVEALTELNASSYKNWANISDPVRAQRRITQALTRLADWQLLFPDSLGWFEGIRAGVERHQCTEFANIATACELPERIDHIFLSPSWLVGGGAVLWPENEFHHSRGLSDHPGVYVDARILQR